MGNNQSHHRGQNQQNNLSGNPPSKDNKQRPQSPLRKETFHTHPQTKRRGTRLDLLDLSLDPSPSPSMLASTSQQQAQPIPVPSRDKDRPSEEQPRGRPRSRERVKKKEGDDRKEKDRGKTPTAAPSSKNTVPRVTATGSENKNTVGADTDLSHEPSYHPPLPSLPVIDSLTRYDSKDGVLRKKPRTGAERERKPMTTPFNRTTVRSSVPTGLRRVERRSSGEFKIPTPIVWRNTAKQVYVTGSFTSVPWRQRILLQVVSEPASSSTSTIPKFVLPEAGQPQVTQSPTQQEPESSISSPGTKPTTPTSIPSSPSPLGKLISYHKATLSLSPGTHRIKFVVDGFYTCSDELPTASDEEGSLVNIIEVGENLLRDGDVPPTVIDLGGGDALHTNPAGHPSDQLNPPEQFWSSDEEWTTASDDDDSSSDIDTTSIRSLSRRRRFVRQKHLKPKKVSTWVTVPPPELEPAVRLEEEYLHASSIQQSHPRQLDQRSLRTLYNTQHILPPAPVLPVHLNNVILNANYGGSSSAAARSYLSSSALDVPTSPSSSSTSKKGGKDSRDHRHGKTRGRNPPSPTPLPAYIATDTPMPLAVKPRLGQGAIVGDSGKHDDQSVLPQPSHVVLNHLATGAIRHGVLACAGTTRYDKKTITTVYYKPTSTPSPPPEAYPQEEEGTPR